MTSNSQSLGGLCFSVGDKTHTLNKRKGLSYEEVAVVSQNGTSAHHGVAASADHGQGTQLAVV